MLKTNKQLLSAIKDAATSSTILKPCCCHPSIVWYIQKPVFRFVPSCIIQRRNVNERYIHLPPNNKGDICFYYFYSYLQNTLVVISHYLARWIYYSIAAIPSYNITILPRTFNVLTDICMFYAQSRMSLRMLNGSMSASVTNLSTCLRYSTLPLNAH